MIKVKHLFDASEKDDGQRLWVEPIGLTLDLQQWCGVDRLLSNLGPPMELWKWFAENPDGYEYFRAKYHEHLSRGTRRTVLMHLATAALQENITLLHQGDDPNYNSAAALHEFLSELQAYSKPE
jgi:uncharacterized protein YeaO (DUF488 family)